MTEKQEDKLDQILSKIYMLEMRFNLIEDRLRQMDFEGCWLRHQDKKVCDED